MKNESLVVEKTYPVPIDRVWQAITDAKEMKQWYFDIPSFKPEPGFEFQFDAGSEERTYRHLCKVVEVIPGKKISYSWRYEGYPGNSLVTFELFDEGHQTRLKLTHAGLETFPQDHPDFKPASFNEGWTYFTGKALKEFLEVNPVNN